ncbi:hypothetical protein GCM10023149_28180 [Mucilaginibacter gynuensis]|uniref:Tetratricopeptide repeat protein n=1 Tax=Mucilaginibacter gynuensis TaxID=1302236 RepID=A0ABP8GJX1_9SPHI
MKPKLLIAFLSLAIFSCTQTKEEKAFKIFNEGVTLSLNAAEEAAKGDEVKATETNNLAIEKFRETLKIDSSHLLAKSALAHSLYWGKKFEDAIHWYNIAIHGDSAMAVLYQERGLCKINLGRVTEGKKDIYKAFELDPSNEIKALTVEDLYDIGKLAYEYGAGYEKEGKKEIGLTYKKFAIEVLALSAEIAPARKDISESIKTFSNEL